MEQRGISNTAPTEGRDRSAVERVLARRILVGFDFSAAAQAALEASLPIAARDGGHVDVLHVYWGPWHQLHYRAPSPDGSPRAQREYRESLQARLDSQLEPLRARVPGTVITAVLREAQHAHFGLLSYARQTGVDLIVVGKPKEDTWRRVIGTDTAWRLICEADCPVLICAGGAEGRSGPHH